MSSPTDIFLLDKEETDQLARSNKKVKIRITNGGLAGDQQTANERLETRDESSRKKVSYRDMVVDGTGVKGVHMEANDQVPIDEVSDDDMDDGDEEDKECPTIHVSA
ncbi:hypothetical protein DITRI_Ditri17bG0081700 [Diplodiscus trichospermus]